MPYLGFTLTVWAHDGPYTVRVRRIKLTDQIQQWEFVGRNKSIIIQNDQPRLDALRIQSKKAAWKVISGIIEHPIPFADAIRKLDDHLEMIRKR